MFWNINYKLFPYYSVLLPLNFSYPFSRQVPYIFDLEFVPQIHHKQFQLDPRSKQFENKFFKMNWAICSWKKYLAYSSIGVAFDTHILSIDIIKVSFLALYTSSFWLVHSFNQYLSKSRFGEFQTHVKAHVWAQIHVKSTWNREWQNEQWSRRHMKKDSIK